MRRLVRFLGSRPVLASAAALLVACAAPARAGFHLIEINKTLTSYNGDATIQAVELRMITSGENLVSGMMIRSYDAAGNPIATHGTFASNLLAANALPDRKILCATAGFASTFGITPDLVITDGVPLETGQISFEKATCFVNAVAYGDVTVPKNGTTSAAKIPSGLAYVLVRTANNGTIPSCPLAENAAARLSVVSGSSSAPVPFSNNSGTTVNVFSSLTGADTPAPSAAWRVYPNPFGDALRIETPGAGPVAVFDVRGRLVRQLRYGMERVVGPQRLAWDGRNARGERVPAGVYFVRYGRGADRIVARVALLR